MQINMPKDWMGSLLTRQFSGVFIYRANARHESFDGHRQMMNGMAEPAKWQFYLAIVIKRRYNKSIKKNAPAAIHTPGRTRRLGKRVTFSPIRFIKYGYQSRHPGLQKGIFMSILPWKLLDSKTIIKDNWINLTADSCQLPNGTVIRPFYVNHLNDFVVSVAITEDEHFILIRQSRHGTGEVLLELPAGCTEKGDEDLAVSAARELLEETGFQGNPPEFLCKIAPNASCLSNYAQCFLITGCRRVSGQQLDSTEDLEVVLFTKEELKKALENNEIRQAVHVAALYYAFQRLSL